jgi:uncharacterized protein DUF5069
MKQTPISAFTKAGGMIYFPRMLDKIRKHAQGELREDFHGNLGLGFDGRCCRYLRVSYENLKVRTLEGGSDDDIFAWCLQHGRALSEEDIVIWNMFAQKRGWRDEATPILEKHKSESGLAARTDLVTFFEYYEADEGRAT